MDAIGSFMSWGCICAILFARASARGRPWDSVQMPDALMQLLPPFGGAAVILVVVVVVQLQINYVSFE